MSLARISGAVYVITFVSGTLALLVPSSRQVTGLVAAVSYIAVTVLFYFLFKPVNRAISMAAALVSLTGCVLDALSAMHVISVPFNTLSLFGVYCLLIGYLVFNSNYLPRALGVLMAFGGIGWLTFAIPSLSMALRPYNFGPGIIAEAVLTLWLLVAGVNEARRNAMVARRA